MTQDRDKQHAWMPDFFIFGAMKCGTSTLHAMLDQHPDVFIPRGEVFYFDIDDFLQHQNFFSRDREGWTLLDYQQDMPRHLAWYRELFADRGAGQLIGEDSTTYLSSRHAAQRIHAINPQAKFIVMLREPAARCYSHYWHLLRTGLALHEFEDGLRLYPDQLLRRGLYEPQLARLRKHFPSEQILVLLLEEMIAEPVGVLRRVTDFLGLSTELPPEAASIHQNRGGIPRHQALQIWRNRLLWRRDLRGFMARLPWTHRAPSHWTEGRAGAWLDAWHSRVNPRRGRAPKMNPDTRDMLTALYRRENPNLAAQWSLDLQRWWGWQPQPGMDEPNL